MRNLLLSSRVKRFIQLIKRIHPHERYALLAVGGFAAAAGTFIELAEEMREEETRELDESLLRALRNTSDLSDPIGPLWLEEMMRDFTALGSVGVLTCLTLAVVGFFLLNRQFLTAWTVAVSITTGTLLSQALKWGFERPRPDLVPHLTPIYTASFPSGHAMLSALVYLTLGALLAHSQTNGRVKLYVLSVMMITAMLVGFSRIYLGVHWPSDVLAGWAAGAGWAFLWWGGLVWWQGRQEARGIKPAQ